ncbi:hypothetical protein LY90DRAFT_624854 [Neocallimastix californiae]|uniref:Periplasmic binding protein-like II n=1 Tax=Neocallimastix californiae TaxID=1754190 RepID=A0A1Y2BQZ3_9FUNG|nr:hypothetical protein LY90DRAFT_624854 [Neocallimastix californiae]|eukprot:ORY37169.1 hypothetical protein LY90DRAFT_624854 [Neocallimastix californiae]
MSQTTIDALLMLKKIKNDISSESLFRSTLDFHFMNIIESKYLFTTYYYNLINPKYKISVVPGIKEGISGSTIQGYNIGIYKYSKKLNLNAAVEALKFITTKEIQKECKPYMNVSEYNSYSNYFRKNIFDFLFENKDINEVLEKIEDYTKIYYISINSDDTNIGLISIIIIFGISTIMIISLIFLFIERYKSYYNFLSTDFWIITILGLLLYNISCLTEMDEITNFCFNNKLCLFIWNKNYLGIDE